jgi:glycerol uptake facilitator protein
MQNNTIKEFYAELFGTMIILIFGNGVCAMNALFNLGGYTNITFGWGIAVFLGIIISNKISGAHLNPAITIALSLSKRFSWKKAPVYITAQMLGGFIGSLIVYIFFRAKFLIIDPTLVNTASIFTTFPAINDFYSGFFAEVIATALLMFCILNIVENFNTDKATFLTPFAVSALIIAIGMSLGAMHGYAMNPARDFSPRVLISLLGFKNNGLTNGSFIWVTPVIGPIIGAIIGTFIYDITLKTNKPNN